MTHPFRIALAQYPLNFLKDFDAYVNKLDRWVSEAVKDEADLLVFPEYSSMELVSLLPEETRVNIRHSIKDIQTFWTSYDQIHQELAIRYQTHIIAGSFPKDCYNISAFYGPKGKIGERGKHILTRFEREEWDIRLAPREKIFETDLGAIGIAICYEAEFPIMVRDMATEGARLIVVPSCTDTLAGYHRVRIGCQARALENQCYVAQIPTVGEAKWSPGTDINMGAAALYGPPDLGFPETGVIVQGELNKPGWVYGEIDFEKVTRVRQNGEVLNYAHWNEQK